MVFLNRIYTKAGDDGQTMLGDGSYAAKTHPRIVAYGGVDELNAVLGLARTATLPEPIDAWLSLLQNELFDLGADLCVPEDSPDPSDPPRLRMTDREVARLESWIDEINERLEPLDSFVLPGGSTGSAWLHLARTVCRRVEVDVWKLRESTEVSAAVTTYLNRLSDLLFVLAQFCNDEGRTSVKWAPGQSRATDE